jgi:hypothetical protein
MKRPVAGSPAHPYKSPGRRFATFLFFALLAIVLADIAAGLASPAQFRREVEDAVQDLRAADPDILVISSSHGRSFHVLGQELAKRTNGGVSLVAFPLEAGTVRGMEWVLRNRAVPILDERDASGNRKRKRLKQLIFGVTWWDTCRRGPVSPLDQNVVSRAWTLNDYMRDVAVHGVTVENRNFVQYNLQRVLRFSRLLQPRSQDPLQTILDKLMAKASAAAPGATSQESSGPVVSPALAKWREDIETGQSCLFSPSELEALERMEAFARERGLDFTVVLFPLMPETITPAGQQTLDRFADLMKRRGQKLGYRVIDMVRLPVLSDADFMRDMDHLSDTGNAKFADWALGHELSFLLDAPRHPGTRAAP